MLRRPGRRADSDTPPEVAPKPAPERAAAAAAAPQRLRSTSSGKPVDAGIDLVRPAVSPIGRVEAGLDRRLAEALARGERLVLVITGKGGKQRGADDAPFMHDDQGLLRQQVPGWLRHGPHARQIVGIYEAPLRHGGAGACYVYLKKRR